MANIRDFFTKIVKPNLDILAVFISIFFIEILFRIFLGLDGMNAIVVLFNIGLSLFISSWMMLMGKKTRLVFSIIVFIILGILAFGQIWHYQYFSTFFSFAKASILSELDTVKGEAADKFDFSFLVFLLPIVLFIVCFIFKGQQPKYKWKTRIIAAVLAIVLGIGSMVGATALYPSSSIDSESDQYLFSTLYNKVKSANNLGFFAYEIKDFDLTFLKNQSVDEDEEIIRMYIQQNAYQANTNQYTDMFEGKNIVLVLCESLSPGVIDEDLTPTLSMMKNEGFSFNNHYAPIYQTATCDSEFISLTGMIPSVTDNPIAYHYYNNAFPTALPNVLKNYNYSSNSFHAYDGEFYNRRTLHYAYGFTYLYDWKDFGGYTEAIHDDFLEAYNWIHDKYLAKNIVEETIKIDKYPFFDFMISVTGHIPYHRGRYELYDELWATIQLYGESGEKYSEEVLCYFAAQKTLDTALQEMIEDFDEQGVLEDTVFIIYGDHYPYGMSQEGLQEYYGNTYDTVQMYKTPFIIWTPDMEGKQIDRVTSTFDIYPTICNLFGIDIDGEFITGVDALDPKTESTVIFSDYSWLTDDVYYDATTQEVTKFTTNMSDESIKQKTDQVFEEIDISQRIISSDYYNEDKEEDK